MVIGSPARGLLGHLSLVSRALEGLFSATVAASAKNGRNAGGPFESGLQSR